MRIFCRAGRADRAGNSTPSHLYPISLQSLALRSRSSLSDVLQSSCETRDWSMYYEAQATWKAVWLNSRSSALPRWPRCLCSFGKTWPPTLWRRGLDLCSLISLQFLASTRGHCLGQNTEFDHVTMVKVTGHGGWGQVVLAIWMRKRI
jgi:hypothetical protein